MPPRVLTSKELKDARAAVGRAQRQVNLHPDDPECRKALLRAKQEYKELHTEHFLREVVSSAPPLTSEQRTRLAALLVPATPPARTRKRAS